MNQTSCYQVYTPLNTPYCILLLDQCDYEGCENGSILVRVEESVTNPKELPRFTPSFFKVKAFFRGATSNVLSLKIIGGLVTPIPPISILRVALDLDSVKLQATFNSSQHGVFCYSLREPL